MLQKNDTLILFGRSPYINKIKKYIPDLCKKYHTMGCNYFVDTFPEVEYVIFYDDICPNFSDKHKVIYNALRIKGVAKEKLLKHKNKDAYYCRKWVKEFEEHLSHRCLNFYFHTPSIALNWAWLHGYKNVVLAGIDLQQGSKHFDYKTAPDKAVCSHWKDIDIEKGKIHLKFVNEKYLNVYQLNPESDIDIPKISIEELLNV